MSATKSMRGMPINPENGLFIWNSRNIAPATEAAARPVPRVDEAKRDPALFLVRDAVLRGTATRLYRL